MFVPQWHTNTPIFCIAFPSLLLIFPERGGDGLLRQRLVQARGNSLRLQKILPLLDEEEQEVFRRGRNSRTAAVPKGASVGEYHTATAQEALFGYLWLKGRTDRLNELFEKMMED